MQIAVKNVHRNNRTRATLATQLAHTSFLARRNNQLSIQLVKTIIDGLPTGM